MDFSINSKFFHFMYRVADLMILSLLWLLCSLPVFTLGAAGSALYYCIIRVVRQEGDSPTRTFFRAFRDNFKQGTLLTVLVLGLGGLLSLLGTLFNFLVPGKLTAIYSIYLVAGLLTLGWLHYAWAYLARFRTDFKTLLKNSLVIALVNLPTTISLVVLFGVAVGGWALYLPRSLMLLLLLPGVYCLVTSLLLERVFIKYLPEP